MTFETFEHKADVGIRGIGKNIEKSFEEAAKGLFNVQVDIKKVKSLKKIIVKAEAEKIDELFIEFLNQLIAVSAIKRMVFKNFHVKITPDKKRNLLKIKAEAFGEKLNLIKHNVKVEVKAATYGELKVYLDKNKNWISQCIVDV